MATQTSLTLTQEAKTFYDLRLLDRALPRLIHAQFGQRRPLARRIGKTIEFRKFSPLSIPPGLTPLTEGVTPAGNSLAVSTVTATISQLGDFVEGSDWLDLTSIDPVMTETADLLGEQAGLWMDRVIREVIVLGTNVQYAAGRASRVTVAATDILTVLEIRKAVRTLKMQNIAGVNGGDYVALLSPRASYDLQSDTAWQNAQLYAGAQRIYDGEIGRLYGVRFVETTESKVFTGAGAAGIDVYGTLVLGDNAYGLIELEGADLEFYHTPLDVPSKSDPLRQRWQSGWKVSFTSKILNDLALVRIEHAVGA